jgi:ribonuclease R
MKAKYSEHRSRHFGLALEYYAHFTSPIRRYPDLAVHRILSAYLGGMDAERVKRKYASYAREAAQRSSDGELRALSAERAIDDLYKCLYMKKHEGEEFDARIVSVQSFGFFCALDNTCEGLVSVSSLSGYYVYSEKTGTLSTRSKIFAPGDSVRVRVKFSDVIRRRIDLEYLYTIDGRGGELLSGK